MSSSIPATRRSDRSAAAPASAASEGEQALGEVCAALGRKPRRFGERAQLVVTDAVGEHVGIEQIAVSRLLKSWAMPPVS